jgi:hypothetical protein
MTDKEEALCNGVFAKWKSEAAMGKPADFHEWTFFGGVRLWYVDIVNKKCESVVT